MAVAMTTARFSTQGQSALSPLFARYGFDQQKAATLYLLYACGKQAYKIGVTNNLKQRLYQLKSKTPFSFEVVAALNLEGRVAWRIEKFVLKHTSRCGFEGFTGATEWRKACSMLDYLRTRYGGART